MPSRLIFLVLTTALALTACSNRPKIEAVQLFYQDGVPHSDRVGRFQQTFDEETSFLPLAIYHALADEHHGRRFTLQKFAQAGFNAVHPWEGQAATPFIKRAKEAGLQVIAHWPKDQDLSALSKSTNLLAWYLDEEPSFRYPPHETDKRLAAYDKRRSEIRRLDQYRPIIVIDGPPTSKNLERWKRWNAVGDVGSHFNYPVTVKRYRKYGPIERVAETTTMARRLVDSCKPIWIVIQAFGGEARGWRMPEPKSLRSMAYAAIIHGATGLIYFAYDSFVTRDDGVLGIAPAPARDYGVTRDYNTDGKEPLAVTDAELVRSRDLYAKASDLNAELAELRRAILSATSRIAYSVNHEGEMPRDDAVRTLLKPYGDVHLLLAINVDVSKASVKVRFERSISSITTLFADGLPKTITKNGFSDDLASEEVKLYRVSFVK